MNHQPLRYPNDIATYRRRLGYTQRTFAKRVGVTRDTVVTWECGYIIPRLPRLFTVARELNTIVENLYWPLYNPVSPVAQEMRERFRWRRGNKCRLYRTKK